MNNTLNLTQNTITTAGFVDSDCGEGVKANHSLHRVYLNLIANYKNMQIRYLPLLYVCASV